MSTRLEQVYPDVAAGLQALPLDRQSRLVQQVALDAARSTGLPAPPPGRDLAEWSDALDSQGWSLYESIAALGLDAMAEQLGPAM